MMYRIKEAGWAACRIYAPRLFVYKDFELYNPLYVICFHLDSCPYLGKRFQTSRPYPGTALYDSLHERKFR